MSASLGDNAGNSNPYQFMPALSQGDYESLKADIRARGVQVPVELDECGNTLDGHHRTPDCRELRDHVLPTCRSRGHGRTAKQEHSLRLNLSRRHLSKTQRREIVMTLRARGWSTRRIAAVIGVSAPTVLRDLRVSGVSLQTPEGRDGAVVFGADGRKYPARRRTSVVVSTERQQRAAQARCRRSEDGGARSSRGPRPRTPTSRSTGTAEARGQEPHPESHCLIRLT